MDPTFSWQGLMLQCITRIAYLVYHLESGRSLEHLERHFHTIHTARQGDIDQRQVEPTVILHLHPRPIFRVNEFKKVLVRHLKHIVVVAENSLLLC